MDLLSRPILNSATSLPPLALISPLFSAERLLCQGMTYVIFSRVVGVIYNLPSTSCRAIVGEQTFSPVLSRLDISG